MSRLQEYGSPLHDAVEAMYEQMAKPENIEKDSWRSQTFDELLTGLSRNMDFLMEAVASGNHDDARRRAANIANFSWMIADKVPEESPVEA